MSEKINDGGPASRGLTIRDWFAGKAMESMCGAAAFNQNAEDMMLKAGLKPDQILRFVAKLSYEQADAMIEARGGAL